MSHDGSAREGYDPSPARGDRRAFARVRDISATGWKQVAVRVKNEATKDRLNIAAAGVAFYAFLALFPTLTALISIWGLLADPAQVQEQLAQMSGMLPGSARELIREAAERIASGAPSGLGIGVAVSLALTIWSANKGMKGLVEGINLAYGEDPGARGFFAKNAVSLGLTVVGLVLAIVCIALVIGLPVALGYLRLGKVAGTILAVARWPILAALVAAALSIIYRKAPPRPDIDWRWTMPGTILATLLWLAASYGFSYYTSNFSSYNQAYGAVAAVAILLMWFFISAFIVLLGAELNAEAEKQTRRHGSRRSRRTRDAAASA